MRKQEEAAMIPGRYPYTYAYDLVRSAAGHLEQDTRAGNAKLSRGDASNIVKIIAQVSGIEKEELAKRLADYFLSHEEEIATKGASRMMKIIAGRPPALT